MSMIARTPIKKTAPTPPPAKGMGQTAPGPRWYRVPEELFKARENVLSGLFEARRIYGDIVRYGFGPIKGYFLFHPDHIQHILLDNHKNYSRCTIDSDAMEPAIGKSLLTMDGDSWRKQRRTMQPAFHHRQMELFATSILSAAQEMLERWKNYAADGKPFDASTEMGHLTLNIAAHSLFSSDVGSVTEIVGEALSTINHHISGNIRTPLALPHYIPTPRNRRFKRAIRALDDIVISIIEAHKNDPRKTDLLSLLLSAQDPETGDGLSITQLRNEVLTMLLAGHETTANALSWTWHLLSAHPSVARELHKELDQALEGRLPTLGDLPNLPYLKAVLQESMRLFPPAWSVSRRAIRDDIIGGFHIPAKAQVFMSSYVTQRHPLFWKNPEGFDPNRFLKDDARSQHPFAYFPFGGGPHLCIGRDFAMLEAQLILAATAQSYTLELVPGHCAKPEPLVTLRPRHGTWVTLRKRSMSSVLKHPEAPAGPCDQGPKPDGHEPRDSSCRRK